MPGKNPNYVTLTLPPSISSVCVPSPTNLITKQAPANPSGIRHKKIQPTPQNTMQGYTHSVLPDITIPKVPTLPKKPIPYIPAISSRELCAFWFREGKCKKGTACRFSHGVAKRQDSKAPVCKHWFQGMCKYEDSCMLWHPNAQNSGAILKELGLINRNGCKSMQTSMSKDVLALARKRAEQARKLREYEDYLEKIEKEKSKASVNDNENSNAEPKRSSSRSFSSDRKRDSTSRDRSTDDEREDYKSRRRYGRHRGRVRKLRRESLKRSQSRSSEMRYSWSNHWSQRRRSFSDSSAISSSSEKSSEMSTDSEARHKHRKTIIIKEEASQYCDNEKQKSSADNRSQSRRRSSRAQQRRRGSPCRKKRRMDADKSQSDSRERYERYRQRSPFEGAEPSCKRYERRRSNSSERRRFRECSSRKSRRF